MKYWLRWLAVLPAAYVAGFLILIPVHFVLYRTLTGSGFITPYPELPERLVSPFFTAIMFVWVGASVAPKHALRTATALLALWIVIALAIVTCVSLSGSFGPLENLTITWFDCVRIAGGVCGAFVSYYSLSRKLQDEQSTTSLGTGGGIEAIDSQHVLVRTPENAT